MASNNGAAANAIGSSAPTSYKIPLSIFPVAAARTKPSAIPLRSMIAPSPMINRKTAAGFAPSAMRIPISRVRRATE